MMERIVRRKCRFGTHRWTDTETNILLDNILAAIQNCDAKFERPCAQVFYKKFCLGGLSSSIRWQIMREKVRHLKAKYKKAKEWNETVGAELFESDKSAHIRNICPYYNKLDQIFGPILGSDPIGFSVIEDDSTADMTQAADGFPEEKGGYETSENDFLIPKSETIHNTAETFEEIDCYAAEPTLTPKNFNSTSLQQAHVPIRPNLSRQILKSEWEQKLDFEKEKFYTSFRLEKEKFEFEKKKFFESQDLRKYEIDKQFEMKKLEIEKEERLEQLRISHQVKQTNELI